MCSFPYILIYAKALIFEKWYMDQHDLFSFSNELHLKHITYDFQFRFPENKKT